MSRAEPSSSAPGLLNNGLISTLLGRINPYGLSSQVLSIFFHKLRANIIASRTCFNFSSDRVAIRDPILPFDTV